MATQQQIAAAKQRIIARRAAPGQRKKERSYAPFPGEVSSTKINNQLESDVALRLLFAEMPQSNFSWFDKEDIFGHAYAHLYGMKNERPYYKLNDRWKNRNADGRLHANWQQADVPLSRLTPGQTTMRQAVFHQLEMSATALGLSIHPTDKGNILFPMAAQNAPQPIAAPSAQPVVVAPQVSAAPQRPVLAVIPAANAPMPQRQVMIPRPHAQLPPAPPQISLMPPAQSNPVLAHAPRPWPAAPSVVAPIRPVQTAPQLMQHAMVQQPQTVSRPSTVPAPIWSHDAADNAFQRQVSAHAFSNTPINGYVLHARHPQQHAGISGAKLPLSASPRDLHIVPDDDDEQSPQSRHSHATFFDQWIDEWEPETTDNRQQDSPTSGESQQPESMDTDEDHSLYTSVDTEVDTVQPPALNIPPTIAQPHPGWAVAMANQIEQEIAKHRDQPLLTRDPNNGPNLWIVQRLVRADTDLAHRLQNPRSAIPVNGQGTVRPQPDLGLLNQWKLIDRATARAKFDESTLLLNGEYDTLTRSTEPNSGELFSLFGKPAGGVAEPGKGKKRKTHSLLQQANTLAYLHHIDPLTRQTVRSILTLDQLADDSEEDVDTHGSLSHLIARESLIMWEKEESDEWVKHWDNKHIPAGWYESFQLNPAQAVVATMYCFGHLSAAEAMHQLRVTHGEIGRVLRYNSSLNDPRASWVDGCWFEALAYVRSDRGRQTWENALAREQQQVGQKRGRLEVDDEESSQAKRRR